MADGSEFLVGVGGLVSFPEWENRQPKWLTVLSSWSGWADLCHSLNGKTASQIADGFEFLVGVGGLVSFPEWENRQPNG